MDINDDESFKTDSIEEPPLSEEKFISKKPHTQSLLPFWLSFAVAVVVLLIIGLGVQRFFSEYVGGEKRSPFLNVTNRQFTLFLMQHPEFMRDLSDQKTGYLPGFLSPTKVTPLPQKVDQIVKLPPEVLFRYHTWKRLLYKDVPKDEIPMSQFFAFIKNLPEWDPSIWSQAPSQYKKFVKDLKSHPVGDLSLVNDELLPIDVRWAFYGWKSYFYEGEKINTYIPSQDVLKNFLETHPNYKRPLWRNLYPNYLEEGELPAFFRLALYYYVGEKERR